MIPLASIMIMYGDNKDLGSPLDGLLCQLSIGHSILVFCFHSLQETAIANNRFLLSDLFEFFLIEISCLKHGLQHFFLLQLHGSWLLNWLN